MNVIGYDPFISVESAWSLSTTIHRAASADDVIAQRTKRSYDSRLNQDYPFFLIDLYGDGMAIGRLAVDHEYLLEIGEDGKAIVVDNSTSNNE